MRVREGRGVCQQSRKGPNLNKPKRCSGWKGLSSPSRYCRLRLTWYALTYRHYLQLLMWPQLRHNRVAQKSALPLFSLSASPLAKSFQGFRLKTVWETKQYMGNYLLLRNRCNEELQLLEAKKRKPDVKGDKRHSVAKMAWMSKLRRTYS